MALGHRMGVDRLGQEHWASGGSSHIALSQWEVGSICGVGAVMKFMCSQRGLIGLTAEPGSCSAFGLQSPGFSE